MEHFERFEGGYLPEEEVYIPRDAYEAPPVAAPVVEEPAPEEDDLSNGVFANVGQGLTGQYRTMMMGYWQDTINLIEREEHDFKNHQLPLARIKKVMKTDEEVRMILAEAPILFAKGCDIFITELTMRAWIHAEENKRRTLQRLDIAAALAKSDMFDFLIDIVPREEDKKPRVGVPAPGPGLDEEAPPPANLLQQHMMQSQMMHRREDGEPWIEGDRYYLAEGETGERYPSDIY